MSSFASVAGRKPGRGRGRGSRPKRNENLTHVNRQHVGQSNQRFQNGASERATRIIEKVKREQTKVSEKALKNAALSQFDSSSDESDLDDEKILEKMLKTYNDSDNSLQTVNGGVSQSGVSQHLQESCRSGATTCLVCISSVKRQEPVWNCNGCFATFHLQCIQRWVREGTAQKTTLSDAHFPNKEIPWYCPKCRAEYKQHECPTRYYCYCGKEEDPAFDPWLVPHSCGNHCERSLQPECGHKCLLLCHPGPCPPCPKTVKTPCFCGKVTDKVVRCGASSWSCEQICGKILTCGKHKCLENCHEGECKRCEHTLTQSCVCGKNQQSMLCGSLQWECAEKCGKALSCGNHDCDKICHKGVCGNCPRSGWRTCPCGKSGTDSLPCSEDVPTCSDTCGKSLQCYGGHTCMRRCHYGPCGPCMMIIEKKCRCGKRKREMPCSKEFTCELKCQTMRNCGNHQCKRKCCNGNCPKCEQICGRTLQCQRHKCQSICHTGRCYPCILTSNVSCRCGKTTTVVVCGKEKTTKPPRCRKPCIVPPSCHHTSRQRHGCHFGPCPTCTQICDRSLDCGHTCPIKCHDEVEVKNEVKAAGPWELAYQSETIVKSLPCPPCQYPVPKTCLGDHETTDMPCFEAKRLSCGRPCGRMLKCGNHECALPCHTVTGALDSVHSGENCAECEKSCNKPRPVGCTHACPLPCHDVPCPPCRMRVPKRCHCGFVLLQHLCNEWTSAELSRKNEMECCGNNCPKLLTCSHFCAKLCHSGTCSTVETCNKKVTLKCPCKRRKRDFVCSEVQQGAEVDCDSTCEAKKLKSNLEKEEKLRKQQEEEDRVRQAEIERFDRKMQKGTKSRRRKKSVTQDVDDNSSFMKKYYKIAIAVIIFAMLGAFSYNLLTL